MSQIDKSKEYTTRDGRPARIYATDAGGIYPVHGTVWDAGEGCWSIHQWVEGGRFWSSSEEDHPLDLVENPRTVTHKLWVNVYEDSVSVHRSLRGAIDARTSFCLETREIEITTQVKP